MVGFHSIKGIWTLVNLDVERFGERFWAVTITVKQRALQMPHLVNDQEREKCVAVQKV